MSFVLCLTFLLLSGCWDNMPKNSAVQLWLGDTIETTKKNLGSDLSSAVTLSCAGIDIDNPCVAENF